MSKWYKRVLKDPTPKRPNLLELADHLKNTPGFMKRLMTDTDGIDKLEDRHPFNTFVEILLGIIALASVLGVFSEVIQGLVALRELGWIH